MSKLCREINEISAGKHEQAGNSECRHRWQSNTKMNLKGVGCEHVKYVPQCRF